MSIGDIISVEESEIFDLADTNSIKSTTFRKTCMKYMHMTSIFLQMTTLEIF